MNNPRTIIGSMWLVRKRPDERSLRVATHPVSAGTANESFLIGLDIHDIYVPPGTVIVVIDDCVPLHKCKGSLQQPSSQFSQIYVKMLTPTGVAFGPRIYFNSDSLWLEQCKSTTP